MPTEKRRNLKDFPFAGKQSKEQFLVHLADKKMRK